MVTESAFINKNAARLFHRFSVSFRYEYCCADYYIESLKTGRCVSKEILFTLDRLENRMVVSRFYPELFIRDDSHYLSATCFYLMIHHFRRLNQCAAGVGIYLTARPAVLKQFYEKLMDFDFHAQGLSADPYWQATSTIGRTNVDTSMITPHMPPVSTPPLPFSNNVSAA